MGFGWTTVRRRAALALWVATTVMVLAVVTPVPVSAHGRRPGPQPEVLAVTGPFTATAQLLGGCGRFNQIVDGEGEWSSLGPSTLHLDFCIGDPPDELNFPVLSGTFTIGASEGTITGNVQAGGSPPPEVGFPFLLDLTITAGTGGFTTATGTLVVDGAFSYGAVSAWGTISGNVTIPPGPPQSPNDCKHGNWRNHVTDSGRPFRNKHHCLTYVRHHHP